MLGHLEYNIIEIPWELRKIKGKIYKSNLGFYKNTKSILGRLVKKIIKPKSIPSYSSQFWAE
jgi:hypothetical protein